MPDKDEAIVTVVKLLAKAESTSEHEAEALRAKVVALRLKHGISDADLEGGQRDREAEQQSDPWGFRRYKSASDLEDKISVALSKATAMIAKYQDPDDRAFVIDKLYRVVYSWLHHDSSRSLKHLREEAVYDCYFAAFTAELQREAESAVQFPVLAKSPDRVAAWAHDRAIFHCTMKTDLRRNDVENMVKRVGAQREAERQWQERRRQREEEQRQKEAGSA